MTTKLMIFLSGSVLALAACGKHDAANNGMATDSNVAAMPGTEATNADMASPMTAQGFANAAAASDKFEVESSKLAAAQGQSSAVKSFADKMIAAHTASTAKLKAIAGAQTPAVTPDDTLTAEQQASLDSMKPLKGADFDKAYAAAQVDAHQKTLDALKGYASGGDNDAMKSFASGMVPTVTAHLNMAKGLK